MVMETVLKALGTIIPVILAVGSGHMIREDIEEIKWLLGDRHGREKYRESWKKALKDAVKELLIDIGLVAGSVISIVAVWM